MLVLLVVMKMIIVILQVFVTVMKMRKNSCDARADCSGRV